MKQISRKKLTTTITIVFVLALVVPTFSSAIVNNLISVEPQSDNLRTSSGSTRRRVPFGDPHSFWAGAYNPYAYPTNPTIPSNWATSIDKAMVELIYNELKDITPPSIYLDVPTVPISGTYRLQSFSFDYESGISHVEFYIDGQRVKTDKMASYYDWDTTAWTDGVHEVKAIAYNMVNLHTETETYQVTVDNKAEKIAVFFWASDLFKFNFFNLIFFDLPGESAVINGFISVLSVKGYTKFFTYEDSSNVYNDLATVEKYEGTKDTVFVYLWDMAIATLKLSIHILV